MQIAQLNKDRIRQLNEEKDYDWFIAQVGSQSTTKVTPNDVRDSLGFVLYSGDDPLKWAVQNVNGFCLIEPSVYTVGKIKSTKGGTFMARINQSVRLVAGEGDTISIDDGKDIAPVVFRGWDIPASGRSAFMTDSRWGSSFDVSFVDCVIDGYYNHATNTGQMAKWGLMPHLWSGYAARCIFRNIKKEHGIYCHEPKADILLLDCEFSRNGRTGCQFVARETEGGYSFVQLDIVGCTFNDNGLNDGGASITAQGIQHILLTRVKSWIGEDRAFRNLYMKNHPEKTAFSTGHVVNWDEFKDGASRNNPTEIFGLDDCLFSSHEGDGHAPVLEIKNSVKCVIQNRLYVKAGYSNHAAVVGKGMVIDTSNVTWINYNKGKISEAP